MKPFKTPDNRYRSPRAFQYAKYSRNVKAFGFKVSIINLSVGGCQLGQEIVDGQPVDPINAAGIFGMVLSIPSNWWNVYQGFYDAEVQLLSTPYYPSDAEIFGNH